MYLVTRHDRSRQIMMDDTGFAGGFEHSTVRGVHMMPVDGPEAGRMKAPHRRTFMPQAVRANQQPAIRATADSRDVGFVWLAPRR